MVSNIELAEQPIEPEFLQIILIDLNELGFDLDLFRSRNARLFDNRVDQFKVVGSVADD